MTDNRSVTVPAFVKKYRRSRPNLQTILFRSLRPPPLFRYSWRRSVRESWDKLSVWKNVTSALRIKEEVSYLNPKDSGYIISRRMRNFHSIKTGTDFPPCGSSSVYFAARSSPVCHLPNAIHLGALCLLQYWPCCRTTPPNGITGFLHRPIYGGGSCLWGSFSHPDVDSPSTRTSPLEEHAERLPANTVRPALSTGNGRLSPPPASIIQLEKRKTGLVDS